MLAPDDALTECAAPIFAAAAAPECGPFRVSSRRIVTEFTWVLAAEIGRAGWDFVIGSKGSGFSLYGVGWGSLQVDSSNEFMARPDKKNVRRALLAAYAARQAGDAVSAIRERSRARGRRGLPAGRGYEIDQPYQPSAKTRAFFVSICRCYPVALRRDRSDAP